MTPRKCSRKRLSSPSLRRGGILFEVLLSIALFVGAATFSLRATRNVLGALDRSRRQALAVDLARAKMAELEAGLITIAELREGDAAFDRVGSIDPFQSFDEYDFDAALWTIDVRTERSEFAGLSLVELTVTEEIEDLYAEDSVSVISFTLRQLVALRDEEAEEYEQDDLLRGLPTEAGGER